MKLSSKILIGFFGVIFLYLTAAFAELRLTGTPNIIDDKNSIAEKVDISGITYIILNDIDRNVKVIGSDRSGLEVRSVSGDMLKKLQYKVSGDTLTLSGVESEEPRLVSVFVQNSSFQGIRMKSSAVGIEGLNMENLDISQNSGRIWMSDSHISKIRLEQSNRSLINISNSELDTLSVKIEESEVHLSSPVGLVEGSMNNTSYMRLTDIREIQVKKDASSNLNVWQ